MTRTLVSAFKALFPALTGLLVLAVLGAALRVYTLGYGVLPAAGVAIGGLLAIIAVFGIVALQIENNALLTRIARSVERQGGGPHAVTDPAVQTAVRPRQTPGGRAEPPIRRG